MGKRITGYLNWRLTRKGELKNNTYDRLVADVLQQQPDHIAVTGDIVNLALEAEFAQARHKLTNLGNAERVSLVFGNHDAYVPGAFAQACQLFAPWITGDKPAISGCFPYMRQREQVAIIGVSSAVATPPFCAAGYFGARQARLLAALLQQAGAAGLFRVVMIHHPPLYHATAWSKRLWGIGRFQNVIARYGAELVLHGHTHVPSLSFIAGASRRVPVVGVASASQDFGGHKPPAGYNVFEIARDKSQGWQCQLTRKALTDANQHIDVVMRQTLL